MHVVNADHLDALQAARGGAGDVLVINDDVVHDRAANQLRVQGWVSKAVPHSRPDGINADGQWAAMQQVLLCFGGERGQPRFEVTTVVCIELSLHDVLSGNRQRMVSFVGSQHGVGEGVVCGQTWPQVVEN